MEEIEFLIAERNELLTRGVSFKIVHRFRIPGTSCMSGEEAFAIFLLRRGHEYQLRLSPALLLLGDYLLRNSRFGQTASQIATGIHASSFHAEHGANGRRQRTRRIPRSAIRVYIERLHLALALVFAEAKLHIDPRDVLVAEESVSNHVLYRWKAILEISHLDSTAAIDQSLHGDARERRSCSRFCRRSRRCIPNATSCAQSRSSNRKSHRP